MRVEPTRSESAVAIRLAWFMAEAGRSGVCEETLNEKLWIVGFWIIPPAETLVEPAEVDVALLGEETAALALEPALEPADELFTLAAAERPWEPLGVELTAPTTASTWQRTGMLLMLSREPLSTTVLKISPRSTATVS